jgi:hypothetical protein
VSPQTAGVVAVDEDFCAHHHQLAADGGGDALRAGRYARRRRQDSTLVHTVEEPNPEEPERHAANGNDVGPRSSRGGACDTRRSRHPDRTRRVNNLLRNYN